MKKWQKQCNFFRKDKPSKEEIFQQANASFDFNYHMVDSLNQNTATEEVTCSEAIKSIPQEDVKMKEVDYYA